MNGPIIRVFGVTLVLFALLAFFTLRWTVLERNELEDNPQNKRALLAQQKIKRGSIYAADGTLLARSLRRRDDTYTRTYPLDGLFAQAVGYSYLNPGTAGLERFYNGQLTGRTQGIENTLRRIQGKKEQGNALRTSLDPDAQRVATMLKSLVQQGMYRPGRSDVKIPGQASRDAMAIAVDTRSNTLMVSASPDNLGLIKEILAKVDTVDFVAATDLKVYKLEHARASNLAGVLTQFLQAR